MGVKFMLIIIEKAELPLLSFSLLETVRTAQDSTSNCDIKMSYFSAIFLLLLKVLLFGREWR